MQTNSNACCMQCTAVAKSELLFARVYFTSSKRYPPSDAGMHAESDPETYWLDGFPIVLWYLPSMVL